jgi:hypothetical protein
VLLLVVGVLIDATSVITVIFMYAPVVFAVAIYGVVVNLQRRRMERAVETAG